MLSRVPAQSLPPTTAPPPADATTEQGALAINDVGH